MKRMKPSKFNWAKYLDQITEDTYDFKLRDQLRLFRTIVGMVPEESYNHSFNYIEEELNEINIDTFTQNDIEKDHTILMDAHVYYHKMFRQIDVFYDDSFITPERRLPIDMLFYNFIACSNAHWYFFKKAVFEYVKKRDNLNVDIF